MAIIRDKRTKDFTVMSNRHLREMDMSLKAKGLLSLMLSLPDEWKFSVKGLCAICKESKAAINSALDELKEHGYLAIEMIKPGKNGNGKIEYEYRVFERPQRGKSIDGQQGENQCSENQVTENQYSENRQQLNTDKSNTDKLNINKSNTEKENKAKEKLAPGNVENVENFSDEGNVLSLEEMRRIFDKYSGFGS